MANEDEKVPRVEPVYLGDGVYAMYDGCGVWLHANSWQEPTDRIYLEGRVLSSLVRQVKEWEERYGQ